MLRALLTAVGTTVAGLVLYGLLVVLLATVDASFDAEVSGASVVVSTLLFAVPFALGAWAGVRAGLRVLPPPNALAAGAGGTLAVFAVVTLVGGLDTDPVSVLLPAAGTALGSWIALRAAGASVRGAVDQVRRRPRPDGRG